MSTIALTADPGTRWPWPKPDPGPPPPTGDVEFSYNPQDRVVMTPGTTVIHGVGPGPSVDRAELKSGKAPAKDGKYVYDPSDKAFHGALTLAAVARTVEIFEKALGEPVQWAFRGKLGIHPDGGQMVNAYYSRRDRTVNFFHATDPVTRQVVYSGDSGEVVAHETGHAILDGLRPAYLGTWSPDPGAFHESFGDVLAMLACLQDDRVLERVVEQTGGDLSRPNMAAHLGEELGITINHVTGQNKTAGDYTRTAINRFVWQDPDTLPEKGGPDQLGREVHSFSRLWTGAFYDVLKGIVNDNLGQGMAPAEALRAASTEGLRLYAGLMRTAPRGDHTYRDMAISLLQADRRYNGYARSSLIRQVFTERRILLGNESIPEVRETRAFVPEEESVRKLQVRLDGPEFGRFNGALVESPVEAGSGVAEDEAAAARVRQSVQRLIADGRILYADPNKPATTRDLFDPDGNPYIGVTTWRDGQMRIERVQVVS
ncbi:MAG: hypothetical protein AB1758_14255 [Candidatus Eremiobacterota bacterium]